MTSPKISWYVLETYNDELEYVPKKKHEEEDSLMPGDTMHIGMQVWNNRNGIEDVSDATDARIVLYFKNYEDNFLLNLCSFKIGDGEYKKIAIDVDRGYLELGTISGKSNNGSDLNIENYYDIEFKMGPMPNNVKSELKDLILDIEYSDTQSK